MLKRKKGGAGRNRARSVVFLSFSVCGGRGDASIIVTLRHQWLPVHRLASSRAIRTFRSAHT